MTIRWPKYETKNKKGAHHGRAFPTTIIRLRFLLFSVIASLGCWKPKTLALINCITSYYNYFSLQIFLNLYEILIPRAQIRIEITTKKLHSGVASSSKIKIEESEDDDVSSSEDEREIERGLAEVTFGELQRARSDGSEMVYRKLTSEKGGGRANKNRPVEMSSKKPVSRFREVIQVPKEEVRNPRFETLCGKLDVKGFKKRYNFLYEKELPAKKQELKRRLKRSTDPEVVNELKTRIAWIDKQLRSTATKRIDKEILAEHKKKEREAAKQGKRPYYLRKSEIWKQKHIEKYEELKAAGKLESFIEKKRRKNAAKDHRHMPYRRPREAHQ